MIKKNISQSLKPSFKNISLPSHSISSLGKDFLGKQYQKIPKARRKLILFSLFITLLGWFVFLHEPTDPIDKSIKENPQSVYWDETYYLCPVEKYRNGTFFMHSHPPLAMLLLTLGEIIIHPNDQLEEEKFKKLNLEPSDAVKGLPQRMDPKTNKLIKYSFRGVRFFPRLMAMFCATLFFLILFKMTNSYWVSSCFTGLYLTDTSIIVHFRGAMLDSIVLFFILLSILKFVGMVMKKRVTLKDYAILAIPIGLAAVTKYNTIYLCILPIFIFLQKHWYFVWCGLRTHFKEILTYFSKEKEPDKKEEKDIKTVPWSLLVFRALNEMGVFSIVFIAGFTFVWAIHVSIAANPIANLRNYNMSTEYRELILAGRGTDLTTLPIAIIENIKHGLIGHTSLPPLTLDNSGEAGSHPLTWPFGVRSISYRWDQVEPDRVRYMYNCANPYTWGIGMLGLFFATVLALSRFVLGAPLRDRKIFNLILFMLGIWWAYMMPMYLINRVMYLYHYHVPLVITYFLAALVFYYLFFTGKRSRLQRIIPNAVIIIGIIMGIMVFNFYKPLAYWKPLTHAEMKKRAIFRPWRLNPAPVGSLAPSPSGKSIPAPPPAPAAK